MTELITGTLTGSGASPFGSLSSSSSAGQEFMVLAVCDDGWKISSGRQHWHVNFDF